MPFMSLLREDAPVTSQAGFGAVRPLEGDVRLDGETCLATGGFLPEPVRIDGGAWLRFALTDMPVQTSGDIILSQEVALSGPTLLRLDEVVFPSGAIAYRHVHPGPGIRCLLTGKLHLQADDHDFTATQGRAWFEAAQSPVQATAQSDASFIRFIALPVEFEGKPSINILDPEDAVQPMLQKTTRHIDRVVQLDAG